MSRSQAENSALAFEKPGEVELPDCLGASLGGSQIFKPVWPAHGKAGIHEYGGAFWDLAVLALPSIGLCQMGKKLLH